MTASTGFVQVNDGLSARSRHRYKRAGMAALTGFGSKVVAAGSVYVMVPLLLGSLGPELFGLWSALQSLIGIMAFADFGVGNGMVNAVAGANARDDRVELSRIVSSGAFLLAAIATSLGVLAMLAWRLLPQFLLPKDASGPPVEAVTAGLAVFISAAMISMPLSCGDRVASAMQEGFVLHPIRAVAQILSMACVYLAVAFKGGFATICVATLAPGLLASAATWAWVVSGRPWLLPRPSNVCLDRCRKLFRSGIAFLLIQVIAILGFSVDTLLISRYAGATAAAEFAIASRFFSLALVLGNIVLAPLWPAYADAAARGESRWAMRTFLYSLVGAGVAGASITGTLLFCQSWLLPLWVGDALPISHHLLAVTAAWTTVLLIGSAVAMFWNGMHWLRLQCVLGIAFVAVSLPLKCAFAAQGNVPAFVLANLGCFLLLEIIPGVIFTAWIFRRRDTHKTVPSVESSNHASVM